MKINKNNYEPYFIDYLEGNLDEKLVDDFLEFLQQNPDLKEELAMFKSVSLEPEEIKFNKRELLYKNKFDSEDVFNNTSVAFMEGDLTDGEKEQFAKYLELNQEKNKEFHLFEKTRLEPDLAVTFKGKNRLYHRSSGRKVLMWGIRIAAVVVLALTFYVLTDKYSNNKITNSQMAVTEKVTPKKETPAKESTTEEKKQTDPTEKQDQKTEKKPAAKTTKPKVAEPAQKTRKSLRENSKGRMNETDVATIRIPVETLKPMTQLTASLDIKQPKATLGTMYITVFEDPVVNTDDERFLADVVKEKTGLNKLSFNKIAKAGLNLVSSISKDKLTYETNKTGKVTEINYDSRLLAFSIPTKGEANK